MILSDDQLFVLVATGIVGALGHRVLVEWTPTGETVTVCDAATMDSPGVLDELDPLRTIVFVAPGGQGGSLAETGRFLHVYPRGTLPVELPGLLALLADTSAV